MAPMATEQARPAIAVAGVSPVTGDATCKGVGETSRSECRLGVCLISAQRCEQIEVLLHRVLAGRALELLPRVPLGARHQVGKAGLVALVVALGGLLVGGIQLEQRGVVGAGGQLLRVGKGLVEAGFEVGPEGDRYRDDGVAGADRMARPVAIMADRRVADRPATTPTNARARARPDTASAGS